VARERTIPVESLRTRVRVQEVGEGDPVLLIHGGPNGGSTFAPLVAGLTGRRSLLLDRPGCGLSGPIEYGRMPLPRMATTVVAELLDRLGIERIDLVGSSFGGAWAMWFAIAHPERVRRLVLFGAPAFVPGMLIPGFMRMMSTPVLGHLITRMPPSVAGAKWTFERMGHSRAVLDTVVPPVYWQWGLRLMADTTTMASDGRAIRSVVTRRGCRPEVEFTRAQLGSITAPTLLYWGDADTFGGADLAHATARLIPDCTVEIERGGGHLPWLDDPMRAAGRMAAFLGS